MLFYLTVLEICPPPHTHTLSDPPLKTFPHPLPAPPLNPPLSGPILSSYHMIIDYPVQQKKITVLFNKINEF